MTSEKFDIRQAYNQFASGNRSEETLRAVFEDRTLDDFRKNLTSSQFGQFVETIRKEFAKRELGLKLYDKLGNVVQEVEGVGSHDKGLDVRGVDEENKTVYAETHKMEKGLNGSGLSTKESEVPRAAERGRTFTERYVGDLEDYELQVGLTSFNGLSKKGLEEVKENAESAGYDVEVLEYDDIIRQFGRLRVVFESCGFDISEDNVEKPSPWPHQLDLRNKSTKGPNTGGFGSGSIRSQNFQVLLYHDCRTGKTYASLFMVEEFIDATGDYPNILLLGPPSLFGDWIDSVGEILQDQPTNVVEVSDGNQSVLDQIEEDSVNFILSSFEMLKLGDENKQALQELRKVPLDFCFTDECHQQLRTKKTQEQLRQLNQGDGIFVKNSGCRWVALSATPHRKFLVEQFDQDEIHTFDHFQKEAKIESDTPTEYDDQPLLKNKVLAVDQPEVDEFYDERSGLNLELLAQDPKRLETLVKVIYNLVYNCKHECRKTGERVMVKDGIWRVSKQEIAEEMAEYARKEVFEDTANIKVVHSDEYDAEASINEAEALFNRIDAEHNILIVVGQLTEGHTFKTVDHTVDLTEFKSHIEVFQFMKRAGTPHTYDDREKGTYFSFDFSIYRTLRVMYEAITAHEENNPESDLDRDDMLGLMSISQMVPVNDVGRYNIVDWDDDEIREQFNNVPSIAKKIRTNLSDIQKLFDENSSVLDGADYESDSDEIEFDVDKGNGSGGGGQSLQKAKQPPSGGSGGGGSSDENPNFEMLKTVWSNLPMLTLLAWTSDESEVKYDVPELVRTLDDKYVEEILGELEEAFSDVEMEFNGENVASAISEVIREDGKSKQKEAIKNLENEINNHSDDLNLLLHEWGSNTYTRGSYADIATPRPIVRKINDQLPDEFWEDRTNTYLDPCCGTGTFLLDAFKRFKAGLNGEEFESEEELEKHIIEDQLYGADIQHKNNMLAAAQLCGDREYNHNIEQTNSLNKNWNMKFDAVVGNPPYSYDKHLKFYRKYYGKTDRFISLIHPSVWLLDEKGKKDGYKSFREMIADDVFRITLFNGNAEFGVGSFVPHSITTVDKENDKDTFKVIDKTSDHIDEYEDIHNVSKYGNSETYHSLKKKIMEAAEEDSLWKADNLYADQSGCVNKGERPNEDECSYYVNLSCIRGTGVRSGNKGEKMIEDDFYTFLRRNPKVKNIRKNSPKWNQPNFFFETKEEAENFLDYVTGKFARFALSIYKNGQNIHRGELEAVPNLDFSEKWTDEKLKKKFNIEDEWDFIEQTIPEYYEENND